MDYEQAKKVGLSKEDVDLIPNLNTGSIVELMISHPESIEYIKSILDEHGIRLDYESCFTYLSNRQDVLFHQIDDEDAVFQDPRYIKLERIAKKLGDLSYNDRSDEDEYYREDEVETKQEENGDLEEIKLLKQIVVKKLNEVFNGRTVLINEEEHSVLQALIESNENIIDEDNCVKDIFFEESRYTGEEGQDTERWIEDTAKRHELFSALVMGKFLNVHYNVAEQQGEISLDDSCLTARIGEFGSIPENYIDEEDFMNGMDVEDTSLSLEELQEKLKEFRRSKNQRLTVEEDQQQELTEKQKREKEYKDVMKKLVIKKIQEAIRGEYVELSKEEHEILRELVQNNPQLDNRSDQSNYLLDNTVDYGIEDPEERDRDRRNAHDYMTIRIGVEKFLIEDYSRASQFSVLTTSRQPLAMDDWRYYGELSGIISEEDLIKSMGVEEIVATSEEIEDAREILKLAQRKLELLTKSAKAKDLLQQYEEQLPEEEQPYDYK